MYRYKAKVVRIIDADTVVLDINLGFYLTKQAHIRLLGVNAPEVRTLNLDEKRKGLALKTRLEKVLSKVLGVEIETTKGQSRTFTRWLGTIYVGDMNINEEVNKWIKQLT